MKYSCLLVSPALLLCLTLVPSAHGGTCWGPPPTPTPPEPKSPSGGNPSGPPRTRPGAASTPTSPGPAGPSAPGAPGGAGGLAGGGPGTFPGGGFEPDLTSWHFWWDLNKAAYLELKEHVHRPGLATGSDGFFLGDGALPQARSLRPTEAQVRELVVTALLAVVEKETNHDLVTGALVALAKIGHADGLGEDGRFEAAVVRLLGSKNQEIRETAAVALGIL